MAWLRDHLRAFRGGLVVISHDTALLEAVVNKVFHLDADRCVARHLQPGLDRATWSSARPTPGAAAGSA